MFLYNPIVWVCFSGRDTHISGCAGIVARLLSRTACSECWSHFKHLRGEATFSRIVRKINLNCPHVIPNPFLILSIFFSPFPKKSTDSPSRAGSLTRRSPICRCPRRNVSSDRHRNRRNHLRCRRYRRPSWAGRWGRNHGQNGPMEGVIKQRTKMGISCRLYPILPNMKFPPLTPWF